MIFSTINTERIIGGMSSNVSNTIQQILSGWENIFDQAKAWFVRKWDENPALIIVTAAVAVLSVPLWAPIIPTVGSFLSAIFKAVIRILKTIVDVIGRLISQLIGKLGRRS